MTFLNSANGLLVINSVFFVFLVCLFIVSIKYKAFGHIAQNVDKGLDVAESAVEAVKPLTAVTPLAPVVNVLDEALKAAQTGAHYAEQLFSNDPTVDRKKIATEYAANAFKTLHIEITPQVAQMLDGAIEAAVLAIPPQKTTIGS